MFDTIFKSGKISSWVLYFVYQIKKYAFLVNELRCWESCWLSAQKKDWLYSPSHFNAMHDYMDTLNTVQRCTTVQSTVLRYYGITVLRKSAYGINSELIGLSFLVHFIRRTSAIFAVEGGMFWSFETMRKTSFKTKYTFFRPI